MMKKIADHAMEQFPQVESPPVVEARRGHVGK